MKTKLLIIVVVVLAVFLTACGGEATNTDIPENQPAPPTGSSSENNVTSNQADQQAADNQPATQPIPPDEGDEGQPLDEGAAVSFADDVLPILQSRCLTCHGGDRIEGELVVGSYVELMAGSKSGAVVLPGDAAGSLLYQLSASGEMPRRGANLTPVQLELLLLWINAGAQDN